MLSYCSMRFLTDNGNVGNRKISSETSSKIWSCFFTIRMDSKKKFLDCSEWKVLAQRLAYAEQKITTQQPEQKWSYRPTMSCSLLLSSAESQLVTVSSELIVGFAFPIHSSIFFIGTWNHFCGIFIFKLNRTFGNKKIYLFEPFPMLDANVSKFFFSFLVMRQEKKIQNLKKLKRHYPPRPLTTKLINPNEKVTEKEILWPQGAHLRASQTAS